MAATEVVLLVGSIFAFIWLIEPSTGPAVHVTYYLLVAAFALVSARAHSETLHSLGFRLDNLAASARIALPVTAMLAAALLVAGAALGSLHGGWRALEGLPLYYVWALAQQYVLQAIVQRRLWDAGVGRRAPIVAALLFMLAHTPNAPLMAMTFAAGWLWAAWYRRAPNLLVLALSHALLAAVVLVALPPPLIGGLRVGPGYSR